MNTNKRFACKRKTPVSAKALNKAKNTPVFSPERDPITLNSRYSPRARHNNGPNSLRQLITAASK